MIEAVIVCGGRHYGDRAAVFDILNKIEPMVVVHGGASGADTLAAEWCETVDYSKSVSYPADWSRYGRAAGPLRNQRMLDENYARLDLVVAFPGGRGTADMVRRARESRVPILTICD